MYSDVVPNFSIFGNIQFFILKKTPNIHTIIKNIKYECENTSPS